MKTVGGGPDCPPVAEYVIPVKCPPQLSSVTKVIGGCCLWVNMGSYPAGHGDIVIAALDGDFTVKELCLHPQPCLKPHNKDYKAIPLSDETQLDVFGVVTYAIHKTYRK